MAVSFPRLPRWLCGGNKTKERDKKESICPLKKTVKKIKRGWRGTIEEEEKGNVVFPEPDDPEWSIGWVEPHGSGFKNDDDDSNGFVVLVPLYKKVVIDGPKNQIPPLNDVKDMEQWLSSIGKI